MKKKKSNFIPIDDGTYESHSSIDHEPKGEPAEQQEMFEEPESAEETIAKFEQPAAERKFKCELTLKLTPAGDKTITLPLLAGEYPSSRIREIILLAVNARRNVSIIEATLDNPKGQKDSATLDQPAAFKAKAEIKHKSDLSKISSDAPFRGSGSREPTAMEAAKEVF